jgi:hypothetical protein
MGHDEGAQRSSRARVLWCTRACCEGSRSLRGHGELHRWQKMVVRRLNQAGNEAQGGGQNSSDETMLHGSTHHCDSMRAERRLRGSSLVARTDDTVEESDRHQRGPAATTQAHRGSASA